MARLRSQVHGEHAAAGVALRRRTALFGVCSLLPLVRHPRRAMEGGTRGEEPAIGARRRAKQETHRAVKSLWEPRPAAKRQVVADAGRLAA
jgi:hypothetical protein